MRKVKKGIIGITLSIAIIVGGITYGFYWLFYDIQRIKGQEYISQSTSANGKFTVRAYLNNGGATVDYAILGTLMNNENGKTNNIYWQYHCDKVDIAWISNETVVINGVELKVKNEIYDYRR